MGNTQDDNVGNLGDILKHACLLGLARALAERGGPITYVDTHAYRLSASPANLEKWRTETASELAAHPAYASYRDIEERSLSASRGYLCSTGLVLAALGQAPTLILGEKDAATRSALAEDLDARGVQATILADACELADAVLPPPASAVLVLVDPITLSPKEWRAIATGVGRLMLPSTVGILEVFKYSRSGGVNWPAPPAGMTGPVAQVSRGAYHLALYATDKAVTYALDVAACHGWMVPHAMPRATFPAPERGRSMVCERCQSRKSPDISDVLDRLAAAKQRATYSAVAQLRGGIAQGVMKDHVQDHRHAWVVQKPRGNKGGGPTGYDDKNIPDSLRTNSRVIETGDELSKWLKLAPKPAASTPNPTAPRSPSRR